MKFIVLALAMGVAQAGCPNMCSGHGSCGNDDICHCYQDWLNGDEEGGDCSKRKCPYAPAWVDTPSGQNTAHALAECSNRGICDRDSGDCMCFDGYTGSACRRTVCPNDCSGHGTCEYIKELRNDLGDNFKWTGDAPTTDQFQHELTLMWDAHKSRACVCDPKWTDIDCSRRMCPKGNYALYYDAGMTDTNGASTTNPITNEIQTIDITSKCNIPLSGDATTRVWGLSQTTTSITFTNVVAQTNKETDVATSSTAGISVGDIAVADVLPSPENKVGVAYTRVHAVPTSGTALQFTENMLAASAANAEIKIIPKSESYYCNNVEFALTFRSTLNEEYTTKTLRMTDSAQTVEDAINSLPNKIVEEAVVTKSGDMSGTSPLVSTGKAATTDTTKVQFQVTFTGSMTTGDQHMLECRTKPCGDGCNPRISNVLDAQIMDNTYAYDNYDQFDSDFKGTVYAVQDASGLAEAGGQPPAGAAAGNTKITLTDVALTDAGCPAIAVGSLLESLDLSGAATGGIAPMGGSYGNVATSPAAVPKQNYGIHTIDVPKADANTKKCSVAIGPDMDGVGTNDDNKALKFMPAVVLGTGDATAPGDGAIGVAGSKYLEINQGTITTKFRGTKSIADIGKDDEVIVAVAAGGAAQHTNANKFTATTTVKVVSVNGNIIELDTAIGTDGIVATDILVFKKPAGYPNSNYGVARTVKEAATCTVTDDTMLDLNSPKTLKALNTECSTRGHCAYDTGICQCFEGYTDEYCSTQAALI